MFKLLQPESSTSGILFDGQAETDSLPCTFSVSSDGLMYAEVSFPGLEPNFFISSLMSLWPNGKPVPDKCLFISAYGPVTLLDLSILNYRASYVNGVTTRIVMRVGMAIEGFVADDFHSRQKLVGTRRTFSNTGDITSFPNFQVIEQHVSPGLKSEQIVHIPSDRTIHSWAASNFEHEVMQVSTIEHGQGTCTVSVQTIFETVATQGATVKELLDEQFKFQTLLQLIHGRQISLGSLKIILERDAASAPKNARFSFIRERQTLNPNIDSPAIRLETLTSEHIESWFKNYAVFVRAITALNSVFTRTDLTAEELLINSFIALETICHHSLGKAFKPRGHEGVKAHEYVDEAFKLLKIESLDFASDLSSIAKMVAETYHEVKHPRSYNFPDSQQTYSYGLLARELARASIFKLALDIDVNLDNLPGMRELNILSKL